LPIVIPIKTTPITDVQVYNDEPRCLATSLLATNSSIIIQALDENTVILGIRIERKLSVFFMFFLP